MPPRIHVSGRHSNGFFRTESLSTHRMPSNVTALWVTDDLLSFTFKRFSATHVQRHAAKACSRIYSDRRHASNVPGPLEARRRLARRRMNNLSIGRMIDRDPTDSVNSDILQDVRSWLDRLWRDPMRWRWEAPKTRAANVYTSSSQPAELPSTLALSQKDGTNKPLQELERNESAATKKVSWEGYKRLIQDVDNLTGLRRLHQDLRGASLNEAACSAQAFSHLISKQASLADLLAFLDDPALNHARDRNVMNLVEAFRHKTVSPIESVLINEKVQEVVANGKLIAKFETNLISASLDMIHKACSGNMWHVDIHVFQALWTSVLKGDIPYRFTHYVILPALLARKIDPQSIKLSKEIVTNLLQSDIDHSRYVSDNRLAGVVRNILTQEQYKVANKEATWSNSQAIEVLNAIPDGIARPLIAFMARSFAEECKKGDTLHLTGSNIIGGFLQAVRSCRHVSEQPSYHLWDSVHKAISHCVLPRHIPMHFSSMTSYEICRALTNSGITNSITMRRPKRYSQDSHLMHAKLDHILAESTRWKHEPATFINWMHLLAAFDRRVLETATKHLLQVLLASERYVDFYHVARCYRRIFGQSQTLPICGLVEEYITTVTKDKSLEVVTIDNTPHLLHALDLYNKYPRVRLAKVSSLFDALARASWLYPSVLWRTLERLDLSPDLPQERLEDHLTMFELAALATARSRYVDLRQAINRVDNVKELVERHGQQPTPALAKAAIVAGVVRPMLEGQEILTEWRFRWVMEIVTNAEGEQVAEVIEKMLVEERARFFAPGSRELARGELDAVYLEREEEVKAHSGEEKRTDVELPPRPARIAEYVEAD